MRYKRMWEELKGLIQGEINFFNTDTAIINNSVEMARGVLENVMLHRYLVAILETMNEIEIDYTK